MDLMTCVSLVIVTVISYYAWEYFTKKNNSSGKPPPCPIRIPFLGNVNVLFNGNEALDQLTKFYRGTFQLQFLHKNFVFLNTYEDVKEAFVTKVDAFANKLPANAAFVRRIQLTSFHLISGPVWKEKRRFTMQHLKNFGFGKSIMEDAIMEEFNRLIIELDKHNGQKMEINRIFFLPFLNITWKMIAGKTYEYDDEILLKLTQALVDLFASGFKSTIVNLIPILQYIPGDPFSYWKYVRASETEIAFTEEAIDKHIETLKDDGEPRDYIEAYLLEMRKYEGKALTDETKCYQRKHLVGGIVDILQGAAHTLTTVTRWALLYMAVWPEIQTKVQQELDTVIGRNRMPTYSDQTTLPFARATMLEVFRHCTVARVTPFRIADRTTTVGAYTIPKGSLITMNIVAVHYDKNYWGDPELFRPERFIDENGKYKPSDNVMPFGIGTRICLGESLARMELFLFFINLMHRYSFHCITGEPLPSIEALNETARHPKDFHLKIKIR